MDGPMYAAVPGLTSQREGRYDCPDIESALTIGERQEDPGNKLQARQLQDLAEQWFLDNAWYYRESAECDAFYAGAQWGFWNDQQRVWVANPRTVSPDVVRVVVNLYKPVVDQATAMLTQDDPHFDVTAAKNEGRDTAASEAASDFTKFWWTRHRLGDKYRLTARQGFHTGTSFLYVKWDPSKGPIVQTGMKLSEPLRLDEMGAPVTEPMFGPSGDLVFEVLPTDSVAPDPSANGDQEGQGIFLRVQIGRPQLRLMFPEKYAEVPSATPGTSDSGGSYETPQISRYSPVTDAAQMPTQTSTDVVWLYTCFARQSRRFPKGAMRIFADGVMLFEGDNPVYPTDGEDTTIASRIHWPVLAVRCDERQGAYFGLGRGVGMIPPSKLFNGLMSKAAQHAAKIANAKVKMPAGLAADFTDEVGQVFRIARTTQSQDIGYINPPPMPQEYATLMDRCQGHMEYIAGIGAATQGQLPSADTSGIALGRLQQRDLTRIAPFKRSLDATWAEALGLGLTYWRRWATGAVKVLVAGENKQTQIREFDAKTFSAVTDVLPFNNTFLPGDPSQRMMWLSTFAQTIGQVQDPQIKMLLIRLANVRDMESFLTNLDPDDVKARRNNLKLMAGESPMVLPCDDALTHKAVLEELMKSEQWEQMVVREESTPDPMTGAPGVSKLKAATLSLWNYFNLISMGQDPASAGMGGVPPSPGGGAPTSPGLPMPEAQASASAPVQPETMPEPSPVA